MWASNAFDKRGRVVPGQCEEVMLRAGGWQKSRMEQQMHEWFGRIPTFIITLAADYCEQCSDVEFCALVEHELYHIALATDEYGAPKFNKETGVLKLRGHDVEEFVGVVRRYGASKVVQEMVDAANRPAEVAHIDVARVCRTCRLKGAALLADFAGSRFVMKYLTGQVKRAASLSDVLSFSRASTGTRVGSTGLIEYLLTDQPAIGNHPTTYECLGVLAESSSNNRLAYSQDFTQTAG